MTVNHREFAVGEDGTDAPGRATVVKKGKGSLLSAGCGPDKLADGSIHIVVTDGKTERYKN